MLEIFIFNKAEMREIENFQLQFFKEEFNYYKPLNYNDISYYYRGYNDNGIFYMSNNFYIWLLWKKNFL